MSFYLICIFLLSFIWNNKKIVEISVEFLFFIDIVNIDLNIYLIDLIIFDFGKLVVINKIICGVILIFKLFIFINVV